MPGPKRPISERTRERMRKMREGSKRIATRVWGGTKQGALKIKTWSAKGTNAVKRVAKNKNVRRGVIALATVALLSYAGYRYMQRPISSNDLHFFDRPTVEYVRHLQTKNKGTMKAETISMLSAIPLQSSVATRSGLDAETISRLRQSPVGRAILWNRILENARAATDNANLSYTWGTQGKVLGKGKNGFEQLDHEKQLAVQVYWAVTGTLLVRKSTDDLGNPIEMVDVGSMHTPMVNSLMRNGAYMKGRVTEKELRDIMEGRKTAKQLIDEHGW